MISDHLRILIIAAALTIMLASGAAGETIVGTELEAAELVADLHWAFDVTIEPATEQAGVKTTLYRFKSTAPIERTPEGAIYLRTKLTVREYGDARLADAAFEELLAGADPNIGLSYAWDQLLLSGALIYRLHAGCLFSEENFRRLADRLKEAVQRPPSDARVAFCWCGNGCEELVSEAQRGAEG